MGAADKYVHGSWNVICQRCGFQYKAADVQKEWTGHLVCRGPGTNDCYEERHPQEYLRPPKRVDNGKVPFVRSEPSDTFVEVTYVDSTVGVQE